MEIMNKRTTKEIVVESFIYSFVVFIVVAISEKIGFSKFSSPLIDPITWSDFVSKGLPKALIIAILFFLGLFFWKLRIRPKEKKTDGL